MDLKNAKMDDAMIKSLPNETEEEEFFLLMSMALDELLDEAEQATFDSYLARYSSLAAQWQEWQTMHRRLSAIPHAIPAANFVDRFEVHLVQHERRRQLRQGMWIGLLTLILWIGATVGVFTVGTYLFVNQSTFLADIVKNVIYFWAAIATWIDSIATTVNAFVATPQALGFGVGYLFLTVGLLAAWISYLRRSTQLVDVVGEVSSPFSTA